MNILSIQLLEYVIPPAPAPAPPPSCQCQDFKIFWLCNCSLTQVVHDEYKYFMYVSITAQPIQKKMNFS